MERDEEQQGQRYSGDCLRGVPFWPESGFAADQNRCLRDLHLSSLDTSRSRGWPIDYACGLHAVAGRGVASLLTQSGA
jgi:hypothetical protein